MSTEDVFSSQDEAHMLQAIDQAHNAALAGEVPVGAVVTLGGRVIATGYNRPITDHDPTAHAEIVAIRQASQILGNYRLPECELFVTLEPCAMCAMAIFHSRIRRVVFATRDPKTGCAGSVINLFDERRLNHHCTVHGGLMSQQSAAVLKSFFAMRREHKKLLGEGQLNISEIRPIVDDLSLSDREGPPSRIPVGHTEELDFSEFEASGYDTLWGDSLRP